MKLFDVLKENALQAFITNKNLNVYIGPDTTDKALVGEVQKALSKHSLAIGKRPQGKYWDNSKKAWTGGTTGIYDNNLKMSVAEWQKSVNNQNFVECTFEGCDLTNTNISHTIFNDVTFERCKMVGLQFETCDQLLMSFKFVGCNLSVASFSGLN